MNLKRWKAQWTPHNFTPSNSKPRTIWTKLQKQNLSPAMKKYPHNSKSCTMQRNRLKKNRLEFSGNGSIFLVLLNRACGCIHLQMSSNMDCENFPVSPVTETASHLPWNAISVAHFHTCLSSIPSRKMLLRLTFGNVNCQTFPFAQSRSFVLCFSVTNVYIATCCKRGLEFSCAKMKLEKCLVDTNSIVTKISLFWPAVRGLKTALQWQRSLSFLT